MKRESFKFKKYVLNLFFQGREGPFGKVGFDVKLSIVKSLQNLSYKTLFTILFFSLAGIVFFLRIGKPAQKVSAAWWDEMWHYRKAISIENTSGSDLTDFQVAISIGTSQLITEGKMQTDCDDIRITDINGNVLPHWIEENNPGCNQLTDTKIWLKANSLPTSGATIYIYYGNQQADNSENGNNVFLEFDDFNNPSTLNNWTPESNPNTTYTIAGGTMSAVASSGDYSSAVFGNNYTDVIVNSRYKVSATQSHGGFIFRGQPVASDNSYQWLIREGSNDNRIQRRTSGSQYYLLGGSGGESLPSTLTAGNWYPVEFRVSGTQVDTYFNNQQAIDGSFADTTYSTGKIGLLSYDGVENYDYIFVRKYASSQPTSSLQSEEINSTIKLGIRSNTAPDLKSKLVAHWKFNENVGTTTYDSSGYNNTGILYGATWEPVKNGIGLSLGGYGSNNYIGIVQTALDNDTSWSVSTKIKYFNLSKTFEFFLGKTDSTTGKILLRHNGYISFRATNGTYYDFSTTSAEIHNTDNTLAFISDGTTIKLYINGIYKSSVTPASTSFSVNTIGNAWTDTVWTSAFLIDELKIYDSAITDEEIKQDYNQGSVVQFGSTNQTIGGTTTSLEYCIPGDTSYCAPPVAQWNFEENTGTIAKDTSGNNNNGTFGIGDSSPTWDLGANNKGAGVKFDGINDRLITNSTSLPDVTQGVTWSSWIYWTGESGSYDTIISKGSNSGWSITIRNSTDELWIFKNGGGSYFDTNIIISKNKWYYVTVVHESNDDLKIYVDGVFSGTTSAFDFTGTTDSIRIGYWDDSYSGGHTFNGKIDDIHIYPYARTPAQIAYDYNRGAPIGHWKLDECQGGTVFNSAADPTTAGLGSTGAINIGPSGSQTSLGTCAIGTSAAWTNGAVGKINSSLFFDGTDDYIANSSSISMTNTYTISVWVKQSGFLSNPNPYAKIIVGGNNNNCDLYDMGSSYSFYGPSGGLMSVNPTNMSTWNHIVISVDGTNGNMYLNGILKSTSSTISVACTNKNIGGGIASRWFNGQIDDVRIYNYALTAEQVKQVYNGGAVNFR